MRKVLLCISCLLVWGISCSYALVEMPMHGKDIDDQPAMPQVGKSPMHMPVTYKDDNTLVLPIFHPEYIIIIAKDDELVFSSIIPKGITEYELPSHLSGEYEIQLFYENVCFTRFTITLK